MKDYTQAFNAAQANGVQFSKDYFQMGYANQVIIADLAKKWGYRKPKNANGSTSRYFYALLKRRYYSSNS